MRCVRIDNFVPGVLDIGSYQIRASVDDNTPLDTAIDCLRFVTEFFEVISQSAPHIYHSALQLVPRSSMFCELYGGQTHSPIPWVVAGVPTLWDSCTASVRITSGVHHVIWSPCGQFVAAGLENVIEVRDSNTLERLYTLKSPHGTACPTRSLVFSPDGRMLACQSKG